MKILLFTLEYPPFKGGVANVYGNIIKHWPGAVETDCNASPVLTRNTKKTHSNASLRGDIFVLHNNDGKLINNKLPFLKWLPAIFQLWRAIKKEKVDYVLVGHILPLGTAAYVVSKFTKIKYSVILHGMDLTFALKTARKKRMAKKILNNAQNIICMNSYVAELARGVAGDDAGKIKVVNPGIDKELPPGSEDKRTTPRLGGQANDELRIKLIKKYNLENKIVLLSVGRLVKRKGFDKVIEALPKALQGGSASNLEAEPHDVDLVYVIAGTGQDEEYLKELAINAPLSSSPLIKGAGGIKGVGGIIFLGKITDEEKWAWLDLCDIFIMPARSIKAVDSGFKQMLAAVSLNLPHSFRLKLNQCRRSKTSGQRLATGQDFEGFGIVYLEANLAGKPVIAGGSGGVSDAVENGVNGLLVDPNDINDIACAITKLAKDKKLRKKLGERGRERAVKEFNWERQVSKIYNIINK